MSTMQYDLKTEQFDLTMRREFFFSTDNSLEMIVYFSAKNFMERIGNYQFSRYIELSDRDDFQGHIARSAIKTYKKIKKAIYAIDMILAEQGEYDSIITPKLKRHVDIIWRYRGILWY